MDYEERQALRTRKASVSIALPLSLLTVIDRFGDAENINISEAVTLLLREALTARNQKRNS